MPSFLYNSKVRAVSDHCSLILQIGHRIDLGRPSDAPCHLNSAALLKSADIVLASDLVMTLSGSFAGAKISAENISKSHLTKHLVEHLRMNATQLGLSYVSGVIYDQGDDRPKVIVRPTCLNPLRLQHMPTCATLKGLDLAYIWQIPFQQTNSNFPPLTGPFAQTLALPYLTLLDDVVKRFVKWHLVKRYPLIFGPWRRVMSFYVDLDSSNDLKPQQLEIESESSLSIYRSIRSIVDRSDNNTFKEKCENKLMAVKEKLLNRTANAAASLYDIAPDRDGHYLRTLMSDEEVLCLAMERLFQAGLQPSKFQMSRFRTVSNWVEDEQLSQSLMLCPTDDFEQRNHKYQWESPPSSSPLDLEDFVDNGSSLANLPLGQHDYQECVERHFSLTLDQGPSEVLEDDISSSQATEAREFYVLPPSASQSNTVTGAISTVSGEGSSQVVRNSGKPSVISCTHSHLMDVGDELLSFDVINYCLSNNTNDRNGSSEDLIFSLENDAQDNPLNHHQGSTEDLFTEDRHYSETEPDGFDLLGDNSSDDHDHSWGDDDKLGLHVFPKSTIDMLDPYWNSHEAIGSVLSGPHLTYHASDISSSTCARTDQVDDATVQFSIPPGLSGATIWNHGKPDSEEFIELDAGWEDDYFLNLIDEEAE